MYIPGVDENWTPTKYHKVCGEHFILGKPSPNTKSQDYAPSIFPWQQPVEKHKAALAQQRKKCGGKYMTKSC